MICGQNKSILGFWGFGVFLGLTAALQFQTENSDDAILFVKEYPLKSGADNSSPDILILHEGIKVTVLDRIGLWSKVSLPNGEQGWLPSDSLVKI